jgi:hypothetical protein
MKEKIVNHPRAYIKYRFKFLYLQNKYNISWHSPFNIKKKMLFGTKNFGQVAKYFTPEKYWKAVDCKVKVYYLPEGEKGSCLASSGESRWGETTGPATPQGSTAGEADPRMERAMKYHTTASLKKGPRNTPGIHSQRSWSWEGKSHEILP